MERWLLRRHGVMERGLGSRRRPAGWLAPMLALAVAPSGGDPVPGAPVQTGDRPTIDEVLAGLLVKYKQDDKKYDALIAKIDKAVRKALASAAFPDDPARHFDTHPQVALVNQLTAAAKAGAGK